MGHRENQNRRLLSNSYRKDSNQIKASASVTYEHEIIKAAISIILIKKGNEIVTEAHFVNGGRADVFDLTTGNVYEVLHTESQEYFNSKKHRYPQEIREIVGIKTDQFQDMNLEQIKIELETIIY